MSEFTQSDSNDRASAAAHTRRGPRRRRADAERSVTQILDAALDALGEDPSASMGEIARRAGLVRATVYVHFPNRVDLIAAVTERALADAQAAIAAAEPGRGAPAEALRRVLGAAWAALARYHPLIALSSDAPPEEIHRRHLPLLELVLPLIERGQGDGTFRDDVPAGWHLATLLALVHAASGELRAGRIAPEGVEQALVATGLGAVAART